jgi:hypothetical protein
MRLEQSQMQPLTTYVAPLGILSRSLLCLLIFGGEYGYAQVDLSGGRHSHGGMGKGWLMMALEPISQSQFSTMRVIVGVNAVQSPVFHSLLARYCPDAICPDA